MSPFSSDPSSIDPSPAANAHSCSASPTPIPDRGHELTLGIGCRRGVSVEQIEATVHRALGASLSMLDVKRVATIESKADEPALVEFCRRHTLPLITFAASEIEGCFSAEPTLARSGAARQHQNVDGVCEPCALLATPGFPHDTQLITRKTTLDGVTVALAASK